MNIKLNMNIILVSIPVSFLCTIVVNMCLFPRPVPSVQYVVVLRLYQQRPMTG